MTNELFNTVINICCETFNVSETSRHRTAAHNQAVGGVPHSKHLGYKAVDLVPDDWRVKEEIMIWLRRMKLVVLDEQATKGCIHVDDRNDATL